MKKIFILLTLLILSSVITALPLPDQVPKFAESEGSGVRPIASGAVDALGSHENANQVMIRIQNDILAEVKRIQIDTSSRLKLEQDRMKLVRELLQQRLKVPV